MHRFLTVLALAALPLAARGTSALACSCAATTFEQAYERSEAVFLGTVLDVRSAEPEYPLQVRATLRVDQRWKGAPPVTVRVLTAQYDAACGFPFVAGGRYLVYARYRDPGGPLWTDLCSRTHFASDGDPDLVRLREMIFSLGPAVPSPASGTTRIDFRLPAAGPVRLVVYGLRGERVRTLAEGVRPAGPQSVTWDGRDDQGREVPAGAYFARLEGFGQARVRRLAWAR